MLFALFGFCILQYYSRMISNVFTCTHLFTSTFDCVFIFQPYKRVGGQKHSADTGRGLIGVADITDLIVYHGFTLFFNVLLSSVVSIESTFSFAGRRRWPFMGSQQ